MLWEAFQTIWDESLYSDYSSYWKLHPLDMIRTLQITWCYVSFIQALLLITEVLNRISKRKKKLKRRILCFIFVFVDNSNVLERNASANIHRSLLHVYHWFITLKRRQKPLKHLSSCTFISDDNLSACAYYVERGF